MPVHVHVYLIIEFLVESYIFIVMPKRQIPTGLQILSLNTHLKLQPHHFALTLKNITLKNMWPKHRKTDGKFYYRSHVSSKVSRQLENE
jgi:hypothetical protein